jgi:hypothetical protein
MGYHAFKDEDGIEHGSFEVFYLDHAQAELYDADGEYYGPTEKGWYWQACFPGCMPDGEACGPFDTEDAAIEDANA